VTPLDGTAQPPLPALPDTSRATAPTDGGAAPGSDPSPVQPSPSADGQQPPPTDAAQILARAEQAYANVHSLEADFVQQVEVPLLRQTLHSHGKLYHRAPDRFLMRFTDPAGDVILADGQYGITYHPSIDTVQVMRIPLAEGGQQVDLQREFLSDASVRFQATLTGSEQVGGRRTHAVTLVPRGQSPYVRVRLWVDAQDYLVRRFEITEQNESVRTVELSNLRPNVTLSDNLFRFTPPPGAQYFP
jgi:outer membrane lipoprotein-sorting protein